MSVEIGEFRNGVQVTTGRGRATTIRKTALSLKAYCEKIDVDGRSQADSRAFFEVKLTYSFSPSRERNRKTPTLVTNGSVKSFMKKQ